MTSHQMLRINSIIKHCESGWFTYIVQDDTRSIQYQVCQYLRRHLTTDIPVSKSHWFSCLQIHLTDGRSILIFSAADLVRCKISSGLLEFVCCVVKASRFEFDEFVAVSWKLFYPIAVGRIPASPFNPLDGLGKSAARCSTTVAWEYLRWLAVL